MYLNLFLASIVACRFMYAIAGALGVMQATIFPALRSYLGVLVSENDQGLYVGSCDFEVYICVLDLSNMNSMRQELKWWLG